MRTPWRNSWVPTTLMVSLSQIFIYGLLQRELQLLTHFKILRKENEFIFASQMWLNILEDMSVIKKALLYYI